MRIDLSDIFKKEETFQAGIEMLLDLSEQTGLTLSVDRSKGLQYEKNSDGTDKVSEKDGQQLGSEKARNHLTDVIDHKDTVKVSLRPYNLGTGTAGNKIELDLVQIQKQIDNVSEGLSSKTMGLGMTFLHELYHTNVGGDLPDTEDDFSQGPTTENMNIIRQQLDANPLNQILENGAQYGIRKFYQSVELRRNIVSKRYDRVLSKARFTILNENGKQKSAHTLTESITNKGKL
jgi:hypothetical protein